MRTDLCINFQQIFLHSYINVVNDRTFYLFKNTTTDQDILEWLASFEATKFENLVNDFVVWTLHYGTYADWDVVRKAIAHGLTFFKFSSSCQFAYPDNVQLDSVGKRKSWRTRFVYEDSVRITWLFTGNTKEDLLVLLVKHPLNKHTIDELDSMLSCLSSNEYASFSRVLRLEGEGTNQQDLDSYSYEIMIDDADTDSDDD